MANIADHLATRFRAILADYERNPTAEAARAAVSRLERLEFGLLSNEDLGRYERLVRRAAGPR